jgi:integrase
VIFAARQAGRPFGAVVELPALTGQRRNEVASMTWQELDLDKALWTIPGNRAKNGRPHVVHLSHRATELIRVQEKSRDLVFPNLLGKPFMSFPRAKQHLDQVCGVKD